MIWLISGSVLGLRSTYEANGAPDPDNKVVYETIGQERTNALERKIKLGFIASSDHRSTHMSFAAVYTKGIDRPSIFESLRARRTFASTDKILLYFRSTNTSVWEEIEVTGTPELVVTVEGTAPVAQIDVIKNSKIVYSVSPNTRRPLHIPRQYL